MSRGPSEIEMREASDLWRRDGSIDPKYRPDFTDCVLPHTQFFHDDFLGGTRGMTPAEGWLYTVCLMEMYSRAEALSLSDSRIARLCGMTVSTMRKAKETLIEDGKLTALDAGLWNEKVEMTFMRRKFLKSDQSKAGIQSGKKRKKNKGRPEQAFNGRSTDVEPISEAQKLNIGDGDDTRARSLEFRERLLTVIGADPASGLTGRGGSMIGTQVDMAEAGKWISDLGLSEGQCLAVVREVMDRKDDGPPGRFKYFTPAMQRLAGSLQSPKLTPIEGGKPDGRPIASRITQDQIDRAADAIAARF